MLIGLDYEKIEVIISGYIIQEPNAVITDLLMAIVSFFLGIFLLRKRQNSAFETWWISFFFLFAISSFLGALGHGFFIYWGVAGKFPNWITAIPIIYFIERAMLSLLANEKRKERLILLALYKMILVYSVFIWICIVFPIQEKPQIAFLPLAINTIVGVILSTGILGYQYSKKEKSFKLIYFGVIAMIPSAFVFLIKINPAPWFDKNDLSHVLMTIGIVFFYFGIEKVKREAQIFIY